MSELTQSPQLLHRQIVEALASGSDALPDLAQREAERIAPIEERLRTVAQAGEATHEFLAGARAAADSVARYRAALLAAAAGRDGLQELRDSHTAMAAARTALVEAYDEACSALPLPPAPVPPHLEAWRGLLLRWMQGLSSHGQVAAVAEALAADLRAARGALPSEEAVRALDAAYTAGIEALEAVRGADDPVAVHVSWPRILDSFAQVEAARSRLPAAGGLTVDPFYQGGVEAVTSSEEGDLRQARCAPCEGGVPPLTPDEAAGLAAQCPDWTLQPTFIERELNFRDFAAALAFVNRVGALAEEQGHHPDLEIHSWNRVRLRLSTHAIGGLSRNDFILAARIDALLESA